jgi:hypothetical protein
LATNVILPPGVTNTPPGDADSYVRACVRPIPANTNIVAVSPVKLDIVDFYYNTVPVFGSKYNGPTKWVCRMHVQDRMRPSSYNNAGKALDPIRKTNENKVSGLGGGSTFGVPNVLIPGGITPATSGDPTKTPLDPSAPKKNLLLIGGAILLGLGLVATISVSRAFR